MKDINLLNDIIELRQKGMTRQEISIKLNISMSKLKRIIANENLQKTDHRKIKINESFFAEYNPISCYVAGLFAADGWITKLHRNRVASNLLKRTD